MSLIKWEPFNEINQLFDDRLMSSFPKFSQDLSVDVYEEKGNIVAKMNLPGVTEEELDVSIDEDILTISGRREEEKETKDKDYYSKEIRRGSFARSVRLPKRVEAEKAEAKYTDGVLTITMPSIAGAKEKTVKVRVGK